MWINDKVMFTREYVDIRHGDPQLATVKAVGMDGTLTIELCDGTIERVDARLCAKATGEAA